MINRKLCIATTACKILGRVGILGWQSWWHKRGKCSSWGLYRVTFQATNVAWHLHMPLSIYDTYVVHSYLTSAIFGFTSTTSDNNHIKVDG